MRSASQHTRLGRLGLLLAVALLAACSRPPSLTTEQASATIQQYLAENGAVCQPFFASWPVVVTDYERRNYSYLAQRVQALASAGLSFAEPTRIAPQGIPHPQEKDLVTARRYHLSALGERSFSGSSSADGKLCYATRQLQQVDSLGPIDKQSAHSYRSSVQAITVLHDVADWAHHPAIHAIFPNIAHTVQQSGQTHTWQLQWYQGQWRVDPLSLVD